MAPPDVRVSSHWFKRFMRALAHVCLLLPVAPEANESQKKRSSGNFWVVWLGLGGANPSF